MNAFDPTPPAPSALCSICRCPGGHTGEEHARRAEQARYESARADQAAYDKKTAEMQGEIDRLKRQMRTDDFQVVKVLEAGSQLVLQVKYPSCQHREFDCVKTLVFLQVSAADALRWKNIDPHFRDRNVKSPATSAPTPAARFPGDDEGWCDAVGYAMGKPHGPAAKRKP